MDLQLPPSHFGENMEFPGVLRPIPRRPFEITPASAESSVAPSPVIEPQPDRLGGGDSWPQRSVTPSRTRSVLDLASSTLLGIYSKATSDGPREEMSTPWGTGAQTPNWRQSIDGNIKDLRADLLAAKLNQDAQALRAVIKQRRTKTLRNFYFPLVLQTALLFLFGVAFGIVVTHLQQTQQITPIPVPPAARTSWYYQIAWGLSGVLIGNALPWIDTMLVDEDAIVEDDIAYQKAKIARTRSNASDVAEFDRRSPADVGTSPIWQSTVRSIGAFIGLAFAVRRVPWQSTMQVSMALAIANPVLWFLIDGSKAGFALSTVVGLAGTFLLLLVNPDFVPIPAIHQEQMSEQIGVYTWVASILFCTSLCFGAIGRKLRV